ncbi:hypothetical protein DYBT9275_04320 [Dyadobacter sp. CECT 9275]|uniref:Protein SCO1/2 n=1 Tax=Dyadobacter helix TaxID=2822344 RepID=A0A916JGB1_9BACT|nr:hypothetical protein [Dyadobacter sp. CECT 9275]CAG5008623.1 hypothetical protein DYBT9275_04320 [Dyadobacter sp. CECT 9275]
MKKYGKAGLLIFTLVIPALIFTFLRYFASNHYDLPYFNPVLDQKGNVVIAGSDTVFKALPEIHFPGRSNSANSKQPLRGNITVINYIPADCGDSCQLVLEQLKRIYALRTHIEGLKLISIAEQPADSLDKSVTREIGWPILTGSAEEVAHVTETDLQMKANLPGKKNIPLFSKLVLIDRKGYTRGYYNGTLPEEIDRLMAELKILNFEEKERLKH